MVSNKSATIWAGRLSCSMNTMNRMNGMNRVWAILGREAEPSDGGPKS